jgi:hypothetical protein
MYDYNRDWKKAKFVGEIISLVCFMGIMGIMGIFIAMSYLIRIAEDRVQVAEKKAAAAAVSLKEYQTVVHALDRCEEDKESWYSTMYDLKVDLSHWESASLYVNSFQHEVEDAKKFCAKCADEKETQLMYCYIARDEQCWCLDGEDSARITSGPSYAELTDRINRKCRIMEEDHDSEGALWTNLCLGVNGRIESDYDRYFKVK